MKKTGFWEICINCGKTTHYGLNEDGECFNCRTFVENKMKYNVYAKRHGKKVKFNKKPMIFAEANIFAGELKKATIPSVDTQSIDVVSIK